MPLSDPDIRSALNRAMDDALRLRGFYWLAVAISVGLSILWIKYMVDNPPEDARAYLVTILPGALGWFAAHAHFSQRLSNFLMPVVLHAMFGMTYRAKAHEPDLKLLERIGLIPTSGRKTPQAEALGKPESALQRVWGLIVMSQRGKSTAQYTVYVCEFEADAENYELTIVPEDFPRWMKSAKHFTPEHPVVHSRIRGLAPLRLLRNGKSDVTVEDLEARVKASNRLFRDQAAFAGIYFAPDRTWMVIRDQTLPLRVFGLFKSRDRILSDLSDRLEELALPFRLAEIWGVSGKRGAAHSGADGA